MRISAPGTFIDAGRAPRRPVRGTCAPPAVGKRLAAAKGYGFTLLEMVVVVAILSLLVVIVLPLLPSSEVSALSDSARRLSALVRYLGDQSVTTKSLYRMQLDLSDNTVAIKKIVNGVEREPEDPFFSRRVMAQGVNIEDIETPRLGKTGDGTINVDFGAAGLGEFMIIHLRGRGGDHFTVTAIPYGGKVEVQKGYQEMPL